MVLIFFFFFSSRRRHTRFDCDWSSDVCSSDLLEDSREKWVEELKKGNPDIFGKGGKRVCVPLIGKGQPLGMLIIGDRVNRSEERRVGKECRSRWSPYQ